MELAQPRWTEDVGSLPCGPVLKTGLHSPGHADTTVTDTWRRIAAEANLTPAQQAALEAEVRALQTYLGLRETSKHYLMHGYALIRRILLEMDLRHGLDGGILFLT